MRYRMPIGAVAVAAALFATTGAFGFDETKYPDLKGQWRRADAGNRLRIGLAFDSSKPFGRGEEAPLTPEYQAIYEANLADQAAGGQGTDPTFTCLSPGMPRVMTTFAPFEIVVTPQMTNFLIQHIHDSRRIFTDGRDWPKKIVPTFVGYSIGRWIDTDGDGRYDVLEIETRGLKGPRSYDPAGLPFHSDNQSIFKERVYSDKDDPNILYDEITTIDNALTRPWTVTKKYSRVQTRPAEWVEEVCAEGNGDVEIGKEGYFLRVRFRTSSSVTKLSQHEADGGKFQEREGVAVEIFPILGETATTIEPCDGSFNNPTLGQLHEPFGLIGSFDDLGFEARQDLGKPTRK